MMFNCQVCNRTSRSSEPCHRYYLRKPDGNIRKELTVCTGCNIKLNAGMPMDIIRQQANREQEELTIIEGHHRAMAMTKDHEPSEIALRLERLIILRQEVAAQPKQEPTVDISKLPVVDKTIPEPKKHKRGTPLAQYIVNKPIIMGRKVELKRSK
jgi:hypothetical protein